VFVVANDPAFDVAGHRREPDRFPGAASLGGIYTAIAAAAHDRVAVVGCDMPLLSVELLTHLAELEGDVVVPRNAEGYAEPLHAVYSRACLGPIEARIRAGRLKIVGFFEDVRVTYVDGLDAQSFRNVNTPELVARTYWESLQSIAPTGWTADGGGKFPKQPDT
jgi:molybdopterin-guanine dinucleotide biosynthesis protein A